MEITLGEPVTVWQRQRKEEIEKHHIVLKKTHINLNFFMLF